MRDAGDGGFALSRRAFLGRYTGTLGTMALAHLLAEGRHRLRAGEAAPRLEPKAKSVICLFQHGGPSQMDLFDPKPELTRWDRKPYPGQLEVHFDKQQGNLLASPSDRGVNRERSCPTCCRTRPGSWTTSPLCDRCRRNQWTTSRH
jgi:hypothetical protein